MKEADENEIFAEAFGDGESNRNACCIFYKQASQISIDCNNSDALFNAIPPQIKAEIAKEDQSFNDEIDKHKLSKFWSQAKQKIES